MKITTYKIKIPVYTTELKKENEAMQLFQGLKMSDMATYLRNKISNFNQLPQNVITKKANKTKETGLQKIELIERINGDIPIFLLKVNSFDTNITGIKLDDRELDISDKLVAEHNYFIMYPYIHPIAEHEYKSQWYVLIYEHPNRDGAEFKSIVKLVLQKILQLPIRNIKSEQILDELKKQKSFDKIQLIFNSEKSESDGLDVKYNEYIVDANLKTVKTCNYANAPTEIAIDIFNNSELTEPWNKKLLKFISGRREIKYSKSLENEATQIMIETAEELYNMETEVTEEEIKNKTIYEHDFIFKKMINVLNNYLSTNV